MARKRNMPNKDKIHEFWVRRLPKYFITHHNLCVAMQNNYNAYNNICMACCLPKSKIQRAHIKSVDSGGTDNIGNLHLLCTSCHEQSENLSGLNYARWLKKTHETDFSEVGLIEIGVKYPEITAFLNNPAKDIVLLKGLSDRNPVLYSAILKLISN